MKSKKFNDWIAIEPAGFNKYSQELWHCLCLCGTFRKVIYYDMKVGKSKNCGCRRKINIAKRNFKHGYSKRGAGDKTYNTWKHVKSRCLNKNHKDFKYYGGRGITVCKRWLVFENFLKDMGEPPTKKLTIDRINNNGNYTKNNCRWATRLQQTHNRG